MNLDAALQTFLSESRELLADMEAALLQVEQAEDKTELVNAIFRAAHTIKGSAGLFRLDGIVAFTHVVESALDRVRSGAVAVTEDLVGLLLACRDHMAALIDGVAEGRTEPSAALAAQGEPLLQRLRAQIAPPQEAATPGDAWLLSLRFGPEVLRNGMDPLNFIRYLQTLGTIVGVVTHTDRLPVDGSMDPEACYLDFEIALQTAVDKKKLEDAFEFVRDDCALAILPPHSRVSEYVKLLEQQNEPVRLGEMLVRCGALTPKELDSALQMQQQQPEQPIGGILVRQQVVQAEVVEAALARQKQVKETGTPESRSVRVDADKLDQLIDLVGELIIAGANVDVMARRARIADLQESASKLKLLVEEVRDSALQLRMVKIGATFARFQRVVRDVSKELGKDIQLQIDGEETELDKTVVEKIGDPLMHLVRNSMDHGIEPAELRLARGKPAHGTLRLNAFHDSGSIVITVQDDGGGLPREKIRAKAVERGLVEPDQVLTDAETDALIFEPGFSTADQVSNLSGRGVGLDVVKRNITALRGSVAIDSTPGAGTTVTIRLPLTLAIIDGFLVGVGKSTFAIPLDMIVECVAYRAEPGHEYTNLRGEVLPFIRLRSLFALPGAPQRGENIVVLKHAGQKAGLVVDTLLGEFQTVIKPLGTIFERVKCVSGSTILGSGDVALILDVPALVCQAVDSAAVHRAEPVPA